LIDDEGFLAEIEAAETCEVFCNRCIPYFHPYHHKIFNSYLGSLHKLHGEQRVEALGQLEAAQQLLAQDSGCCHPALGHYAELAAETQLELGQLQEAVESLQRAIAHYTTSHATSPKVGRPARCHDLLAKLNLRCSVNGDGRGGCVA